MTLRPAVAFALALVAVPVAAQQLPARWYDSRDGLASSTVSTLFEDAQGYLWFGTSAGISRFDGSRFESIGARDGMPSTQVTTIVEDGQGRIWFGTWGGGIGRVLDDPGTGSRPGARVRMWTPPGNWGAAQIEHLFLDARGSMRITNSLGLWSVEPRGDSLTYRPIFRTQTPQSSVATPDGPVWLADYDGLHEIAGEANRSHAWPRGYAPITGVSLEQLPGGRLLVADQDHLWRFTPARSPSTPDSWERIRLALPPGAKVLSMLARRDGTVWYGTNQGVLVPQRGEAHLFRLSDDPRRNLIYGLFEDREGQVWAATANAGVARITDAPVVTWSAAEGVPAIDMEWLALGSDGTLYVHPWQQPTIAVVDGRGHRVPGAEAPAFRDSTELTQDDRGDWWVSSPGRLHWFAGPRLQYLHGEVFTRLDGYPMPLMQAIGRDGHDIVANPLYFGLSPDGSTGVGLPDSVNDRLARWTVSPAHAPHFQFTSLPHLHGPRRIARAGESLWLSSWIALTRMRRGTVETVPAQPGLPDTLGRALFVDHRGWLWIGTRNGGVSVTRTPDAEQPAFEQIPPVAGLSGTGVHLIAEDRLGRMYFASAQGLDRYDPATRGFRHLDARDGLPGEVVKDMLLDASGELWIATERGLARLTPGPDPPPAPARAVVFTSIEVAGAPEPLPARGVRTWRALHLSSSQRRLALGFTSVRLDGREPRFQYRLEGVDPAWSAPSSARSVSYAWLPARRLRFRVRAVADDGTPGPETALEFSIAAPLVQRPWFLALVLLSLGAAGYAWHRMRLRQALALERIRRQIALDLHDDIGSGLSQIAVLSEVARRGADGVAPMLEQVAGLARELRESMGDIIWSVDPRRDHLSDLVRRMREVANQLLEAPGVEVTFDAPAAEAMERLSLAPDRKRHFFLIYKEALHNVAKHARAARVDIALALAQGRLELVIHDDGVGFDGRGRMDGHGLASMRHRAQLLGAGLELAAAPGRGTTLTLTLALRAAEPITPA